ASSALAATAPTVGLAWTDAMTRRSVMTGFYRGAGLRATETAGAPGSLFVPVHPLAPLVALLGFQAHRRDGTRVQPGDGDRLAGLLAIAVGALLDPAQSLVDLGDQLALAIAGAQLKRPVGLRGGAIGHVGVILGLGLEVRQRLPRFSQDVVLPLQQLVLEIQDLAFIHELLVLRRTVILV